MVIRAAGLYRLKRKFEQSEEDEIEGILHRVDLVRGNIAISHFGQTGDFIGLDEYYRELRDGGGEDRLGRSCSIVGELCALSNEENCLPKVAERGMIVDKSSDRKKLFLSAMGIAT